MKNQKAKDTPPVLFHYCSTSAFLQIVSGRKFHLSSLPLSNDTSEGRLVADRLIEMAKADVLGSAATERLRSASQLVISLSHGLGFCMSERKDLLSQWRGYAEDASGLSIGFNVSYFSKLIEQRRTLNADPRFAFSQVKYAPEEQRELLASSYKDLRTLSTDPVFELNPYKRGLLDSRSEEEIEADKEKLTAANQRLLMNSIVLTLSMYRMKNAAFSEEVEWRLVSMIAPGHPVGATKYRARGSRIIPYQEFDLPELGIPCIAEVVLGPRNETPVEIVKDVLAQAGFRDVEVSRSTATYR